MQRFLIFTRGVNTTWPDLSTN